MNGIAIRRFATALLSGALLIGAGTGEAADPATGPSRAAWTTSRVVGSPEPPTPYVTAPYLEGIAWDRPLYAKAEPGTGNLFVVEQGGEPDRPSRVYRVADDPDATEREVVLTLEGRLIYGLEFHPSYDGAGELFVFSNGPTPEPERKNRVSRFFVPAAGRRVCDLADEQVVIEWRSMGHDGGDLCFGRDGMLYISSGDGTSDSDRWLSAQDASNLLGGVLRIDVDRAAPDRAYAIPEDNPFVDLPGARGELWAIGLRNPWRMSVDRATGTIWVGVNGQDLWETAHLLTRGANYGWSVYEGAHPFYLNRQRGPGEFTPPTIEHHHIEFRSLTGGVTYHGGALPELQGVYLYGDYSTGKIWGARLAEDQVVWQGELADGSLQIAGFAESPRGELIVVDHGGGLHRLLPRPPSEPRPLFPRRLSETGLFTDAASQTPAPGVTPYEVNAPAWTEGATARRFLAVPGLEKIGYASNRAWNFPDGGVLVQTLSWGERDAERRIETRLLAKQDGEWAGYSYRWNDEQTDAVLVDRDGEDAQISLSGRDNSAESIAWRFPSRSECLSCHSRAVGFLLSATTLQLNREIVDDGKACNQIARFGELGLFESAPTGLEDAARLVDPYDQALPLDARTRSYLHANCSGCHVEAGGGNARMELEFTRSLDEMGIVDAHPQHDRFGVEAARIVAPGSPERSVLLARVAQEERGRMPPVVRRAVDESAVELLREWIASLPPRREFVRQWRKEDFVEIDVQLAGRALDRGGRLFDDLGCRQCHRMGDDGGGAGPDLSGVGGRASTTELLESVLNPSAKVAAEFAGSIVTTIDGRVFAGRIERQDAQGLVLRTADPFAKPIELARDEVDEVTPTDQSTMPIGLVDTLRYEEVLDLLAFLKGAPAATSP